MGSTFEDAPVSPPGPTETRSPLDGTLLSVGDWALEPIAIVGLSCRYPGGASTPSKLWANLAAGASAWSRGPPDGRFNMDAFHDARSSQSSTVGCITNFDTRNI
jgi:emericellamide synthase (highly reducing iterative type I polyketide synthase)